MGDIVMAMTFYFRFDAGQERLPWKANGPYGESRPQPPTGTLGHFWILKAFYTACGILKSYPLWQVSKMRREYGKIRKAYIKAVSLQEAGYFFTKSQKLQIFYNCLEGLHLATSRVHIKIYLIWYFVYTQSIKNHTDRMSNWLELMISNSWKLLYLSQVKRKHCWGTLHLMI